ncbi:ISAs1 family transposase [Streptomyces sp. NPDC002514]|uniref:ISAs1 family transposase n=1 Tax=Streptomyces sp. NPDC001270 TaxID=3364554 RepID=UPI0036930806
MPDPQRDQGRRRPLAFVLSLAAYAVLAGAKSSAAIAEWAADAPPHVLARLGGPCREPDRGPVAPAEATVRRVLQRIDGDALDTAVGSRLAGRERAAGQEENDSDRPLPSLAVDGKTVRGARRTDGTQVHLLAAMTGTGMVTAQREVDGKTNEITVFQPLLAPLDLHGTVDTFDALHSQTSHARFLVEDKHAHYIALTKGNQPTLHGWLKALPWQEVPPWTRRGPPLTAATRSAGSKPPPSPGSRSHTRCRPSRPCAADGSSPPARSPWNASTG